MLRDFRLTLSGNTLKIAAYLIFNKSSVFCLMWVCFYHIWFQSAQNQASSVIQVQTDLFQAEATEVKKKKKKRMREFSITSALERSEEVFWDAAFGAAASSCR